MISKRAVTISSGPSHETRDIERMRGCYAPPAVVVFAGTFGGAFFDAPHSRQFRHSIDGRGAASELGIQRVSGGNMREWHQKHLVRKYIHSFPVSDKRPETKRGSEDVRTT